jgi:hypothetical protein
MEGCKECHLMALQAEPQGLANVLRFFCPSLGHGP